MGDWAVFMYQGRCFFEQYETLGRLPYLRSWYTWEAARLPNKRPAKWLKTREEFGQWLQRRPARLPCFDSDTHKALVPTADHLAALLAWAHTDNWLPLTKLFTFEELHKTMDYLAPGDFDGFARSEDTPLSLHETMNWRRRGPMDQPARVAAYTILRWMTPGLLAAVLNFVVLIFAVSLCIPNAAKPLAVIELVANMIENMLLAVAELVTTLIRGPETCPAH